MIIERCPHCNGMAAIKTKYSHKVKGYLVFVECSACGAQSKIYIDEENPALYYFETPACQNAVVAWNRKTKRNE